LIKVESRPDTPSSSWRRIEWTYDAFGRRIQQVTSIWTNNAWFVVENLKFVSDSMLYGRHIVEINGTNNTLVRSYVWDLDLSGTMDGVGGVGGLAWVTLHAASSSASGTHFTCYDGNGNIVSLVSATTSDVTARYEYGPFGEPIRMTGPMAKTNPFRFSTKYQDDETGLLYYGYRFYDPCTGSWPNRDLIGEKADLNLYRFNYNDPLNYVDPNGLWGIQFGGFNIGWGDPNLAFDWDSWGDLGQGVAATADGLLDAATFNGGFGLFDPGVFSRLGAYDPCDPLLRTSRGLGEFGGALLLAGSGPRGPVFGRGGPWGRGAGRSPGVFNRGDRLRVGWSWNNTSGRNWFSIHGGGKGAGPHWHWDIIPGPRNPTIWW